MGESVRSSAGLEQQPSKLWVAGSSPAGQAKLTIEERRYKKRNKNEKPLGGTTVLVRNGDVNGAMRVLKKRLIRDGFFQELRERTYFESRGTKRRKEKAAATRRYKRKMQKRFEELGY